MDIVYKQKNKETSIDDFLAGLKKEFYQKLDGLSYKGKPLIIDDKLFNHVTTTERKRGRRDFDFERTKMILTIPSIIKHWAVNERIITFNDGRREILYLFKGEKEDYIVVLEVIKSHYRVVTGYQMTRPDAVDKFYKQRLIQINQIDYSHNMGTIKLNKIPFHDKTIFIDDDVKSWLKNNYTCNLVYRIIANAIAIKAEEVYFLSPKNAQSKTSKRKNGNIITLSRFNENLSEKDKQLLKEIEATINKMTFTAYKSDFDNDTKFLKTYRQLLKFFSNITGYQQMNDIKNELLKRYGYRLSRITEFKLSKQFPAIEKAIKSGSNKQLNKVRKNYKIELPEIEQTTLLPDLKVNNYCRKYLIKCVELFKKTLYIG